MGFGTASSNADDLADPTPTTPSTATPSTATPTAPTTTPTPTPTKPSAPATEPPGDSTTTPRGSVSKAAGPYGAAYPVTLEANFSRPYKALSTSANSDYALLDDLERLIRGSYRDPRTGKLRPSRGNNSVYLSTSRMEKSRRVLRELVKAAQNGVEVWVIHGKASQSPQSRALQKKLNRLKHGHFKICQKGKSLACLSARNGAIMHSKIVMVSDTFTRENKPAKGAIWTGSSNLGGPSGEHTYNNGMTVYNDRKLWYQMRQLWTDMSAERRVNNDYLAYVKGHAKRYGYAHAGDDGYVKSYANYGMFYSNLANVTIYPSPIKATPTNGKDPVMNLLNRIVPDDQCRIRLQENRFKYRRIAVAQKLVQLANAGCKVSAVGYQDNLKANRIAHCQQYIRICRPILDVFKTSTRRIEVAWAKPHDKTIMVEAKLRKNRLNPEEIASDGTRYAKWPATGIRTKAVLAGSAALTGSNLITSDEITTVTTDPAIYEDYLEHWKAIWKSN